MMRPVRSFSYYGPDVGEEKKEAEKTFTQVELDAIVNKRFAKEKTEKEKLLSELNTLKTETNLTKEQKAKLEDQIAGLESSVLSKDEQAAKAKKQLMDEYDTKLKQATEGAATWQTRYMRQMTNTALYAAASEVDAVDPEQIAMMFGSQVKVVEVQDENGKGTGKFETRLEITIPDGKNDKVLDLPVAKALATLKEKGRHPNLFKTVGKPGTGDTGSKGSGGGSGDGMPKRENFSSDKDYSAAYLAWRSKHTL